MQLQAPSDVSADVRPPSLRRNFAWTFAGNATYGASQWASLSLIAKLGGTLMLGEYALAVAVTLPVGMLSHLNLRTVLATDVERRHPFGDYIAVRMATTAAALVAIAGLAFASGYGWPVPLVIMLAGLALSAENVSDIYYGPMQRREQMDRVARSMIARGLLSTAALGATLWFTRDLAAAIGALALARIAVLFAYDRPRGSAGESLSRSGWRAQAALFRTALPLGVVLMLVSLTTNLPRYAIEHRFGMRELGAFSAAASFIVVGSTIMNALGQSATPRLARYFNRADLPRFRGLALRLVGIAVLVGIAGVLVSAVAGRMVLRILYRPELETYSGLLTAVMAAGILIYAAVALGYVISSARAFTPQMPLLAFVAASSGIASWILVPSVGLSGAAAALALAGFVQISGELFILRRALRQPRARS